MKFGLKDSEYQFLDQNLIQPLKNHNLKVYLFGSRATGKNHPFSDIDILLAGQFTQDIDRKIFTIKDFFEESNFPYKVDIVRDKDLAKSYWPSVDRDKIEV